METKEIRCKLLYKDYSSAGDDEHIQYVISNRELIRSQFLSLYDDIYADIETNDEILQRLALRSVSYSSVNSQGVQIDGIYRLIEQKKNEKHRQIMELYDEVGRLEAYEEHVNLIWRCQRQLPEELREVLDSLLIKKVSWKKFARSHQYSESTVSRLRKKAFSQIRSHYEELYQRAL